MFTEMLAAEASHLYESTVNYKVLAVNASHVAMIITYMTAGTLVLRL